MKKSIVNIGKTLDKKEQQKINGGELLNFCRYRCNGRNYVLVGGQGNYCYLNFPAIIPNHPNCGGSGGGTPIYA
ncbi:hypothetical protein [Tenacibaculum agarivorans]|uniref:hypothetical protein n=1 Tax=Tenacibaculum agarivorans TaxID=1908389 RepID=UPI00094BAC6F|nr:hypothetical protein [Tenacibaculum agarivorans]